MSKLVLRSRGLGREFELNCLQFNAPIVASISSVQTREMLRHFPIKVNQSDADFLVQFSSEKDFEEFQGFVRKTQKDALTNDRYPGVTLWWPERDIRNWTGVIKSFKAGGMRRNYSPRAQFTVSLIESSVALRSFLSTIATPWQTLYGLGSRDGFMNIPTQAEDFLGLREFGSTLQQAADTFRRDALPSDNINNGGFGLPEGVLTQGNGDGQ
jgi:hypothetical protein